MTILTPSIESRKATLYQMFLEVVDKWAKSNDTEVVKGYRTFGQHLAPMVQSVISMFEELRYMRPSTVSKETYYSVKSYPLQCQKRPIESFRCLRSSGMPVTVDLSCTFLGMFLGLF